MSNRPVRFLHSHVSPLDTGVNARFVLTVKSRNRDLVFEIDDYIHDHLLAETPGFLVDSYARCRDAAVVMAEAMEFA